MISTLIFTAAADSCHATGLLGYVSFRYGDLQLDGITLRRTAGGRLTLSFPNRVDRHGVTHPLVRPWDQAARTAIETGVLELLGDHHAQ